MKKLIAAMLILALSLSGSLTVYAADKPAKVENLKIYKSEYNSLRLSWDEVKGAETYEVYRSATGKAGSFLLKKTVSTATYTNTGLTMNKKYYYKVRAINEAGKGTFSEVKSNYPLPAQVTLNKISLGLNTMDNLLGLSNYSQKDKIYSTSSKWREDWRNSYSPCLKWSNIKGASGYQVYRTVKGKGNWKKVKTTTYTYFVEPYWGFNQRNKYEWKVRAYRKVKGKNTYGYFSESRTYIPDWTPEEIKKEAIAYGESIEGERWEYIPEEDRVDGVAYKKYDGPEGRTYTLKHYENPDDSPKTRSWSAACPAEVGYYDHKETVLYDVKSLTKSETLVKIKEVPLIWCPADDEFEAGWIGEDYFTLYYEPYRNGYDFYYFQ